LVVWIARRPCRAVNDPPRNEIGKRRSEIDTRFRPPVALDSMPDEPVAFGYKIAWLAIRSTDTRHVARVVGLLDLQGANWETGLEAAFRGQGVFVSPPVEGWIFVAGIQLPEPAPAARLPAWQTWIRRVAQEFSEVQYFANHRVTSFHAWARFIDGRETRAFSSADGEIYVDRGSPAAAEKPWAQRDDSDCVPDEEDVLRLAAEWGVSPMNLEECDYPRAVGLLGRLP
jgi:hypothetical protein